MFGIFYAVYLQQLSLSSAISHLYSFNFGLIFLSKALSA